MPFDPAPLKELIRQFPKTPGVYLMKNHLEKIIYVGKAKSLRNRVQSYFSGSHTGKTAALVKNIRHIDYILTQTEAEAFLLEASLIKKHRPRYNVRLKDDKSYPYIKLSLNKDYPRFALARKTKKDGAAYYGPYASSFVVRTTIEFLNHIYQIRDCTDHFMRAQKRPCLTHEIGRCTAPCMDYVSKEAYAKQVKGARSFFKNKNSQLLKRLEKKMLEYSEEERFELAARVRDNLRGINKVLEKQAVIHANEEKDQDVFNYFGNELGTLILSLHVRQGRVIGQRSAFFSLLNCQDPQEDPKDWLISYLNQYYKDNVVPDEVLLPLDIGNDLRKLLSDVLKLYSDKDTTIRFPTDEIGGKLLAMSLKNAQEHYQLNVSKSVKKQDALELIQRKFKLPELPRRIECYDISHFQGDETVGSQVVFEDGVPNNNEYRRYKIKTVKGINDFESIKEVLSRRLKHEEWDEPQLIVVDGGKGQLSMALQALKEIDKTHIPVVGLAKERTKSSFSDQEIEKTQERFYLPNRQNPVVFSESSEAFRILVSLRDEAHRFAITFHRKLREGKMNLNLPEDQG